MEPIIVTDKLRKKSDWWYYQLGLIDIAVHPGEVLGVIGPKNSGKSMLLRLIWGFTRPDYGTVRVLGFRPHLDQIKLRKQAGYTPQEPPIYTAMTLVPFTQFIGEFYENWDKDYVTDNLSDFRLPKDIWLAQYTKGMRVKLALVAATGHHPRVLILDDPTAGAEPGERNDILRFIRKQARKENVAIVISSSVEDDLDEIADSILLLKEGRVVEYAAAQQLQKKYKLNSLEAISRHALGSVNHS